MSEDLGKTVCFDYSHNNTLTIESPSYADFTQYLFGSSFRLGKIQAGITSIDKLAKYRMLVIGGPRQNYFELEEIQTIVEFVKNGGNLLIIHDEGGDYEAETNLNELTEHFGFTYNADILSDSMNFLNIESRILVKDLEPHPTTRDVDILVQSGACSIDINKLIEADDNVHIHPLAQTSLNTYRNRFNGEEWIEYEDCPRSNVSVAVNYYSGRVVALSTVSMFSSLSSSYGFFAQRNQNFIVNIFSWLLEPPGKRTQHEEKLINVQLNYNLFAWVENLVQERKWGSHDDIINFSLKYLKDNYEKVMGNVEVRKRKLKEERQKQIDELSRIDDEKERQRQIALMDAEANILTLSESSYDTAKDLQEIMAGLSSITGGEVGTLDLERMNEVDSVKVAKTASTDPDLVKESEIISEPNQQESIDEEGSDDAFDESREPIVETNVLETESKAETYDDGIVQEEEKPPRPIPKEELSQSIKSEFELKLQQKLSGDTQKEPPKDDAKETKHKKSKADEEIELALKKLGSFDDFTKKLEQFKSLSDGDAPVSIDEKQEKEKPSISDDELFE